MTSDEFWKLIGLPVGTYDEQCVALRRRLEPLSVAQIEAFELQYRAAMARAFTWDLWGAAYLINYGCSDDGFEYFRSWLVSRGRVIFESALADPDSLAAIEGLAGEAGPNGKRPLGNRVPGEIQRPALFVANARQFGD